MPRDMKYLVGLVTVEVVVGTTWCPLTVTAQPLDLHIFPWLPGPWSLDPAPARPVLSTGHLHHAATTHSRHSYLLHLDPGPGEGSYKVAGFYVNQTSNKRL